MSIPWFNNLKNENYENVLTQNTLTTTNLENINVKKPMSFILLSFLICICGTMINIITHSISSEILNYDTKNTVIATTLGSYITLIFLSWPIVENCQVLKNLTSIFPRDNIFKRGDKIINYLSISLFFTSIILPCPLGCLTLNLIENSNNYPNIYQSLTISLVSIGINIIIYGLTCGFCCHLVCLRDYNNNKKLKKSFHSIDIENPLVLSKINTKNNTNQESNTITKETSIELTPITTITKKNNIL